MSIIGLSENKKNTSITIATCIVLALITFVIYFNVLSSDFLSMDDPVYVTENPYVKKGITVEGISWALDFGHESGPYWMPLTMLSHMIDCQLFGLDPSKHHLTSLIIHCITSILLFLFFFKVTGSRWKGAFIAALFAFHPMNVESVAWITSRKNVLNAFFWVLTLLLYVRYLERKELGSYLAVLLCYFAGLMTKPSIITLIFTLLLLDTWPFYRFIVHKDSNGEFQLLFLTKKNIQPLIEKLPFFALTAIILFMNFSVDNFASEAIALDAVPVTLRISNALVSNIIYLYKLIVPINLSVFYSYPSSIPLWQTIGATVFCIGMSLFSVISLKKRAWVFTGWFWFVGNLVMVSGIIQGGYWPAYADRFVYIAQIGFFILVIEGGSSFFARVKKPLNYYACSVSALIFLIIIGIMAHRQVSYWENGIRLYTHALEVNGKDVVSKVNLAFALDKAGQSEMAIRHYRDVVQLYPGYWQAHTNLGIILFQQGKPDKALLHLEKALSIKPDAEKAVYNAAIIYENRKMTQQALALYLKAAELNSNNAGARFKAGLIYEHQKMFDKAVALYKEALNLQPDNDTLKQQLEVASQANDLITIALEKIKTELHDRPTDPVLLSKAGNIYKILEMSEEAEGYFNKALKSDPMNPKALSGIAEVYIMKKEYDRAAGLYKRLLKGKTKYTLSLYYNLACVYSLKKEPNESVKWLKKAVDGGFKYWDIIMKEKQFDAIRETDYFKQIEENAKQKKQN